MASGGTNVKEHVEVSSSAPPYLALAKNDLGKNERTNRKELNARIKDKLGYEFDVKSTPWCAVWVAERLETAGYASPKKANARSFLNWGYEVTEWKEGDIVVFWRGTRNDGVTGHVGFLLKWDGNYVTVLGGNQGDEVSIQRFPKSKILGVRRYRSPWGSRTVKAAATKVAVGVEEVVRHSMPTVETATESKGLLEQAMGYFPNMGQCIGIVIIALGAYIIYRKIKDMKNV